MWGYDYDTYRMRAEQLREEARVAVLARDARRAARRRVGWLRAGWRRVGWGARRRGVVGRPDVASAAAYGAASAGHGGASGAADVVSGRPGAAPAPPRGAARQPDVASVRCDVASVSPHVASGERAAGVVRVLRRVLRVGAVPGVRG